MKKIKNIDLKFSLFFNIIIVILTVFALTLSVTGFKFMNGYEPAQELSKAQFFSYFTVQSNTFMGIVSLLFAIKEIQVIKGTKKTIPFKYYMLKMIATIAVSLTFLVVFAYLGFMVKGGIRSMLRNGNLFYHFIIPIISIMNFIIYEKTNKIKFKHTIYGLLPTILYEIYYIINILLNMKNGQVSTEYDWYYLLQNGVSMSIIVAPLMLTITYILTFIIWRLNRKK